MTRLLKGNSGQAFAEYTLILALVAVACLAAVNLFSAVINKYYSNTVSVYTVPIP